MKIKKDPPFGEINSNTDIQDTTGNYMYSELDEIYAELSSIESKANLRIDGKKFILEKSLSKRIIESMYNIEINATRLEFNRNKPDSDQFRLLTMLRDKDNELKTPSLSTFIHEKQAKKLLKKYSENSWDYVE